jgi:hypothetical protein
MANHPSLRWTGTYIEPDVLVIAGIHTVVFEGKLYSPFGQYHETLGSGRLLHQLAVQYAAVRSWAAGQQLQPPVVVAVAPDPEPPRGALGQAAGNVFILCQRQREERRFAGSRGGR